MPKHPGACPQDRRSRPVIHRITEPLAAAARRVLGCPTGRKTP